MSEECCQCEQPKNGISCDQVAWLLDVFDRYLPQSEYPAVSQKRYMMKYAMLYEVMEVARLDFEDDSARWNGTPDPARNYSEPPWRAASG